MKHRILPICWPLAMIALIGVVLYWNGNYVVYRSFVVKPVFNAILPRSQLRRCP